MEILHIKQIVDNIGLGCTNPMKAITDDGRYAVIKLFHNGQGNKVLFNEFFAYQLAHILGIPTPYFFIGIIDEKTTIMTEFENRNFGLCFCSEYIDHTTTILPEAIKRLENAVDFYNILLFDHFVYNADRNDGNLLVTLKPPIRMYAIDYSHIFTDGESWDHFILMEEMKHDIRSDRTLMNCNATMYQLFISHLGLDPDVLRGLVATRYMALSSKDIYDIIHATPEQCRPVEDDCQTLVQYLMYRQGHLFDMVSSIIDQSRERS